MLRLYTEGEEKMMIEECQSLFESVVKDFKNTLEEENFDELSLEGKKVSKFLNGYIYIVVDDDFTSQKINKFYLRTINKILTNYTTEEVKFKFLTAEAMKDLHEEVNPVSPEQNLAEKYRTGNIDATYTFQNFVVANSNRFAYTYAAQTADRPGFFNPLYIFGGVGIGKTHLMEAIGNYMLDKNISTKVLYVEAKEFCDDYIHACKQNRIDDFHNRYRDLDVLLVDDIQLLCGKDKTQEEFFTLFNYLVKENKQIVITCDRPASSLDMMPRLTSRFDQGLSVDIEQPELELRINIIKKKLRTLSNNSDIPDDVIEFIASSFTSNIRELEGALKRVIYYSVLNNSPITLDLANDALSSLIQSQKNSNKYNTNTDIFENIKSVVASFYGITVIDLIGKKRSAKITLPRHIAMYLLKNIYDLPYKRIGQLFDNRDHTTVMSACEKIENDLKTDQNLKLAVENIKKKLNI